MRSLRLRLTVVLAIVAFAVSVAATAIAYAATDHQLSAQVTNSVQRAANQLVNNAAQGPVARAQNGPQPIRPTPAPQAPARPAGALGLVVAQRLGTNGSIQARFSSASLPVTSLDRSIAASLGTAPPALRTERVDGVPYLVETVGLRGGGAVEVGQSLQPTLGVLGALRWRFVVLAALLVLLAGTLGLLIARRVTTPLEQLTATAERVAASGTLDTSVPATGRDEVGRLGRSFEAMLGALRHSRAQQQQLIRDAGHELRTPLTSLRTNIDLLRRHGADLPADALQRLLDDLDSELRELSGLMEEVIELGTDTRSSEPTVAVRIDRLLEGAVGRARGRSGRAITLESEPWTVSGRSRALERVVSNLIENALKFSAGDEPVEVTTTRGSFSVRDHGPGFAAEDLPRVFDRFFRSDSAQRLQGSGLGLAIVKEIVAQHDGRVAASNAEGGGGVVTVWLEPVDERTLGTMGPDADHARS